MGPQTKLLFNKFSLMQPYSLKQKKKNLQAIAKRPLNYNSALRAFQVVGCSLHLSPVIYLSKQIRLLLLEEIKIKKLSTHFFAGPFFSRIFKAFINWEISNFLLSRPARICSKFLYQNRIARRGLKKDHKKQSFLSSKKSNLFKSASRNNVQNFLFFFSWPVVVLDFNFDTMKQQAIKWS